MSPTKKTVRGGKGSTRPAVATVEIGVDECDNITYHPSVLHVSVGQKVKWVARAGHFALTFKRGFPFSKVRFHSTQAEGGFETEPTSVVGPVGIHHYQSAIFTGNKVVITAGCPEIIVD